MKQEVKPRVGIGIRAIILGMILVPINCYWVTMTEIKFCSTDSTCVSLFMTVVTIVFFLTLLNMLVAKRFPRAAFNQAELMVVYIMLSIATAMCGHDMMGNLLPNLANVFYFDTPQNGWAKLHPFIPQWFAPRSKEVLRGFYEGSSSLYTKEHLLGWATPVAVWGAFLMVISYMMLCLNVLIRKQWADREKLTFPIIQMPLEMTKDAGTSGFFSNKYLWAGIAVPVILESLNELNFFYPTVPAVQIKIFDLGPYITTPPWNGVGWFPIAFYPFAIGLTFLLPADLSFSCWFFYLLRKFMDVQAVSMGFHDPGASPAMQRFPYFGEQSAGAWIAIALYMVYSSRKYLWEVLKRAMGKESELDDSNEPMTYRSALIGIAAGLVLLFLFCLKAGASPYIPVIFFFLYFVACIAITRIRAEFGPPAHELNFFRPEEIMTAAFGTKGLGVQNMTIITYFYWFNRGYRNLAMPHQLEAFKIGEVSRTSNRQIAWIIMLATFVGIIATFWALLHMYYTYGAATAKIQATYRTWIGSYAFDRLNGWVINPKKTDVPGLEGMVVGVVIAMFLTFMKARFLAWPFHPIGYGLAVSFAMDYFWCPALIGWLFKTLTVKYGGIKAYRQVLPFFIGLILGDYVISSIWTLIGWAMGVSTYRTFIG